MTLIYRGALHKCQFSSLHGVDSPTGTTGPTFPGRTPVPEDYFYVTGIALSNRFNPIRVHSGKFDFMQHQYQGSVLACSGVILSDTDLFKALLYQDLLTIEGTTQLKFTCVRPISLSLQGGPNGMLSGSMAWSVGSVGEYTSSGVTPPGTTTPTPIMPFTGPSWTSRSCLRCDLDNDAQVRELSISIDYQTQYIGMLQQPIAPAREGTLSITMVKGTYPSGPTGAYTSPATTTTADVTAFTDMSCYGNKSITFTSPKSGGKKLHFIDCVATSKQVQVAEPISNSFYIMKRVTYSFKNFEVIDMSEVQIYEHSVIGWEFVRTR